MTRIIAHRGNLHGPNIFAENKPEHILNVLSSTDFSVEVDIRLFSDPQRIFFGHDYNQYEIQSLQSFDSGRMWFHAKTPSTYVHLMNSKLASNIFYHETDAVVSTSHNVSWVFPGRENEIQKSLRKHCVLVLPEVTYGPNLKLWDAEDYYGVCTDYPFDLKEYLDAEV